MSDILSIALDLGTTSIKAGLLNPHGELVNIVSQPAPPITSTDQHYESDALAYAKVAAYVLHECRTHAGCHTTLGLCSQRSSMLVWDSKTGIPVTPLISWQDGRGAQSCLDLQQHENQIRALSGLPLTPYYYSGKLRVLLQQNPHWRSRLIQGDWMVGTLDTFLIWRWSGRRHFVTDASMAARTQLLDIGTASWSTTLCELFGIPGVILPTVLKSQAMGLALDDGLTLQASVGDQSAALIASVQAGTHEALANLGTGCFVVRYVAPGETHHAGYLKTLVYQDEGLHLAVEGTLNSIAAALSPYPVSKIEYTDLAKHDIYALAEPSGLGAPYFKKHMSLQFSASVEHLAKHDIAALLLEAVIFRVARIVEDMHHDHPLERVYLSGGLANLTALQQGIAQCVPCEVYLLEQSESSLLGAAMLAAGLHPGSLRKAREITVEVDNQKLLGKFQYWKAWLDELLCRT